VNESKKRSLLYGVISSFYAARIVRPAFLLFPAAFETSGAMAKTTVGKTVKYCQY